MDQPGTDREALLKNLQKELDGGCIAFGEGEKEPDFAEKQLWEVRSFWKNIWKREVFPGGFWRKPSGSGSCFPAFWIGVEAGRHRKAVGRAEFLSAGTGIFTGVWSQSL